MQRSADAGLEQMLRRFDVVVRVDPEIPSPALADARLCRQVKHVRHALERRRQIGILNPRLDEPEAWHDPRCAARFASLSGRG